MSDPCTCGQPHEQCEVDDINGCRCGCYAGFGCTCPLHEVDEVLATTSLETEEEED